MVLYSFLRQFLFVPSFFFNLSTSLTSWFVFAVSSEVLDKLSVNWRITAVVSRDIGTPSLAVSGSNIAMAWQWIWWALNSHSSVFTDVRKG